MVVLCALLTAWVALCLAARIWAERLIFPAPPCSYAPTLRQLVHLPTGDGGQVAALYLENPSATHTLLFCHGNGEDLGYISPYLRDLRKAGWSVIGVEYPGYGLSPGTPSEAGCIAAASAAYRYLRDVKGIPADRIVPFGRSVGSGPAIELASREPVGGLIVQSGFVSTYRVLTRWPVFPGDRFPNLTRIANVRCPVLVIHGQNDGIIPFWHGEALFAAVKGSKMNAWFPNAGHNDVEDAGGPDYWAALTSFRLTLPAPQTPPN